MIDVLKKISDRVWIPHHAALEYQRSRVKVIREQLDAYDKARNIISKAQKQIAHELGAYKKHSHIKTEEILNKVAEAFATVEKELEQARGNHPDQSKHDDVLDTLSSLFEGKVGPPYSPEKLVQIQKEGRARYKRKIPPGYEDAKKDDEAREYGDLIIWFQMIDKAKASKRSFIFVTDEQKEDWWLKIDGETLGPRPELIQEMHAEGGVAFYAYAPFCFMEYARRHLQTEIHEKTITEIRERGLERASVDTGLQAGGIGNQYTAMDQLAALREAMAEQLAPLQQFTAMDQLAALREASRGIEAELQKTSRAMAKQLAPLQQFTAINQLAALTDAWRETARTVSEQMNAIANAFKTKK
jgi:hypothetical protein